MRGLSVAGSLDLLVSSLGKPNDKNSQHESVGSLALNEGLNHVVPLLHELAQHVLGHVHSVEVGIAVSTLHFFNLDLHLPPGLATALVLQVSQRNFKHSSFQAISGNLYTLSLRARSYFDRRSCCKE